MSPHERRVSQRHHGLDWLRIGAFGLLILHHIGMYFAPGTWLVKAPERLEWITWPMLLVQPWRMPLLFLVSGFATYAIISRSEPRGSFVRKRSIQLLMPLVAGLLLINPPQMWVFMTENRGYRGDLLNFWGSDWLSFRSVSGVFLPHAGHLWFLCYLWFYTMLRLGGPEAVPDLTLRGLVAELRDRGVMTSYGSVWRIMREAGVTLKTLSAVEQLRSKIARRRDQWKKYRGSSIAAAWSSSTCDGPNARIGD